MQRVLLLQNQDRLLTSGALEGMYETDIDLPFPPSQPDGGTQPSA
ncbi:hypothetical protein [Deinococcus hopiensis]|uniref:Uncharacterized protein n=1 Tax=Deinococcus hopiensis KR-140 TaxID=695939 RepID=A0A1W1VIH2_9DEIO|nr:hypothetical protein [Deinococcus hopiensis]SMB93185.1 hypothetical protein SAMN00790413_01881 [Deinococcus hopiensis KR-140]